MKTVVFVCQTQYGYHIDTYYYTVYLAKHFRVKFICYDDVRPKYNVNNVEVVYIPREKSKIRSHIQFIYKVRVFLSHLRPDFVFVKHFSLCSLLVVLNKKIKSSNLDVRTGSVAKNSFKRFFEDAFLFFDSLFYCNQTVISESLKKKWFVRDKAIILPLGAELYKKNKIYSAPSNGVDLVLFYVGSIVGRNLDVVISGLHIFFSKNPDARLKFNIAGDYNCTEGVRLFNLVEEYDLADKVKFLGYLNRQELYQAFDTSDVGVVHVPKTKYYDCQPSTKLFEFLLSGIPVIASNTTENTKVVEPGIGVLYESNSSSSFAASLEIIIETMKVGCIRLDSLELSKYSWESISKNLINYIEECICE